jgi:hypothetical protein
LCRTELTLFHVYLRFKINCFCLLLKRTVFGGA